MYSFIRLSLSHRNSRLVPSRTPRMWGEIDLSLSSRVAQQRSFCHMLLYKPTSTHRYEEAGHGCFYVGSFWPPATRQMNDHVHEFKYIIFPKVFFSWPLCSLFALLPNRPNPKQLNFWLHLYTMRSTHNIDKKLLIIIFSYYY